MQRLNRGMMGRYEIPEHFPAGVNAVQFGMTAPLLGVADRLIDAAGASIGICAVQAGETGGADILNAQDGMYTLLIRGEEGEQPVRREQVAQCVLRAIDPEADFAALEALAVSPALSLALLDTESGALALGLAAQLLAVRHRAGLGGLAFICLGDGADCGDQARDVIRGIASGWSAGGDFARWLDEANQFYPALAEGLVFRATPEEAAKICADMNYSDGMLHLAEPFARLTIQAPAAFMARFFPDGAPGVFAVDDLAPALLLKHRIYDAGLFTLAAAGWLQGCDALSDCMKRESLREAAGRVWMDELLPRLPVDREVAAARIIETMARFENPMHRSPILLAADHLFRRFTLGALPAIRAYADENFDAPPGLSHALACTIMLYAGARKNATGQYEVLRGKEVHVLRDDPSILGASTLSHDMSPDSLAYAVLADRNLWNGLDLRDIDGLESRVTLSLTSLQLP